MNYYKIKINQQTDYESVRSSQSSDYINNINLLEILKLQAEKNLKKKTNPINNKNNIFEPYWNFKKVEIWLKENKLLKSKLRINQRNYKDAYLTDIDDKTQPDIYIDNIRDRNRALNGDIVAVYIKEKYNWKIIEEYKLQVIRILNDFISNNIISTVSHNPNIKLHALHEQAKAISTNTNNNSNSTKAQKTDQYQQRNDKRDALCELTTPVYYKNIQLLSKLNDKWFQKTAKVVYIFEKKNSRIAAGHLKLFPDANTQYALFSPTDPRLPRIQINLNECPNDFYLNSQQYEKCLFIAEIIDMPANSIYAIGKLKCQLGSDGNINTETDAILIENNIDFNELNEETLKSCLPQLPWSIPDAEYKSRRDLRSHCVFTIDPATARDLDDALHCIQLNDDMYEIGVHIADVSYFVNENTLIDQLASERTTSVYLVQKVIPMLPRCLCEHLCSLNPNENRLTFSVIWKINSNGDILNEWFGRSIISSVCKLSYENAQKMIDNPTKEYTDINEFPPIRSNSNINEIRQSVLNLNKIAKKLRQKRYDNGCLTLNQIKISFILNKQTQSPYGCNVYEQKDSNRLVEEFMLLANIAVAHHIYKHYPDASILRRHPSPNEQQILQLAESIREYGYDIDLTTSTSIQSFLHDLERQALNDEASRIALITLTCLITKTMQLAQYFCSGTQIESNYHHYGLAVPLYTHFTSPIRRYPDILVHRLLAASLGYIQLDNDHRDCNYLQKLCEICNEKKYAARICSERSIEMYFSLFINECGPIEEYAFVIMIKDHSFDVLINNLGIVKRIYCDRLDILQESIEFVKGENKRSELKFMWKSKEDNYKPIKQIIKLFSKVNVSIIKHDSDPLKYNVLLKHPNDTVNRHQQQQRLESIVHTAHGINTTHDDDYAGSTTATDNTFLEEQRIDIDPYICD